MDTDSLCPWHNDHLKLWRQIRSGPKAWLFYLLSWRCHTPSLWASLSFVRDALWRAMVRTKSLNHAKCKTGYQLLQSTLNELSAAVIITKHSRPSQALALGLAMKTYKVQRTSQAPAPRYQLFNSGSALWFKVSVICCLAFFLPWTYFSNEKKCGI